PARACAGDGLARASAQTRQSLLAPCAYPHLRAVFGLGSLRSMSLSRRINSVHRAAASLPWRSCPSGALSFAAVGLRAPATSLSPINDRGPSNHYRWRSWPLTPEFSSLSPAQGDLTPLRKSPGSRRLLIS